MEFRKFLFVASLILAAVFAGFVYNTYKLDYEWDQFFHTVVNEESERVTSILEASLESGGDPVDTLSAYMDRSRLLKAAAIVAGGGVILIPGSNVPKRYILKKVNLETLSFQLYFDGNGYREFKKHIYVEFFLSFFIAIAGFMLFSFLWFRYARQKLFYEKQKAKAERAKSIALAISSVLHEVKNIINNMNFVVYRIKSKSPTPEIQLLEEEMQRLKRYLQELSDLRKPLELTREDVEISDLVKEVVEEFTEILNMEGVAIELALEECWIKVDKERLKMVFRNLIKNAVEALKNTSPKKIKITGKKESRFYIVEVSDSAGGLPDNIQEIFLPFKSSKEGGFGLGLFNVRRIIEAHGGSVEAEKKGDWSVFRILIPVGNCSAS